MGTQGPTQAQRIVAISPDDGAAIDLRDPGIAALLSWLVPGLGQLWQGRRLKGWLFLAAIGGALVAGLWIGGGRVVYCQWRPGARRLEFLGQAGIGAVAIPALVQSWSLGATGRPFLPGGWFVPPLAQHQPVAPTFAARLEQSDPGMGFYRDGRDGAVRCGVDQLSRWYLGLGRFFDVGTLYATIAGLLNMLVVYDAWSGPLRDPEQAPGAEPAPRSRGRRKGVTR